jgi:hypothetical protein
MPYKNCDFGGRFANRDRRQSPNKTSSAGRLGGSGGTRRIQNGNLQRSQHPNPRSTITNPFRNTSLYNDDMLAPMVGTQEMVALTRAMILITQLMSTLMKLTPTC